MFFIVIIIIIVFVVFSLALSRAKDAAGNISFKDIQNVQEKVTSLSDQFDEATQDDGSKKDD